jgi:hypothetical protein
VRYGATGDGLRERFGVLACGLLAVAALGCGGRGSVDSRAPSTATPIGTLAYVVTECREGPEGRFSRQALYVRQGDGAPVQVMDLPWSGPLGGVGLCASFGLSRLGMTSVFIGAFQRIGVSPDGSMVAFEVTDDFAVDGVDRLARDDQEGFFLVRADGTGLLRLGPASRDAGFRVIPYAGYPTGRLGTLDDTLSFSPDGREITFTDLGPGPEGEEAPQVVTIDLASGERRQVTRLPRGGPENALSGSTWIPVFIGDDRIAFQSFSNPDGLNPEEKQVFFTVRSDGADLQVVQFPQIGASGRIVPRFAVSTGGLLFGAVYGADGATELGAFNGTGFLQLTNFVRPDTAELGAFGSADGRSVFFSASADPFGTNPQYDCQLFSIGALGDDLRQLTFFKTPGGATDCLSAVRGYPGCTVSPANWIVASSQDARTGTLVFYSSCDPEGGVPTGGELYAMRPDGSGLRALTETRGVLTAADGAISVELPGPHAYGPYR